LDDTDPGARARLPPTDRHDGNRLCRCIPVVLVFRRGQVSHPVLSDVPHLGFGHGWLHDRADRLHAQHRACHAFYLACDRLGATGLGTHALLPGAGIAAGIAAPGRKPAPAGARNGGMNMARSSETIEPRGRAHGQSPLLGGATFELRHRLARVAWSTCWLLFARWTPPQLQPLRRLVLRAFGADIHPTAMVRSSVKIWWPGNLKMGVRASMGPGAICYNVAPVTIEDFALVSQRAHLCTGTHDIDDPDFPLRARPISIGRSAWVAAEAFVGPG